MQKIFRYVAVIIIVSSFLAGFLTLSITNPFAKLFVILAHIGSFHFAPTKHSKLLEKSLEAFSQFTEIICFGQNWVLEPQPVSSNPWQNKIQIDPSDRYILRMFPIFSLAFCSFSLIERLAKLIRWLSGTHYVSPKLRLLMNLSIFMKLNLLHLGMIQFVLGACLVLKEGIQWDKATGQEWLNFGLGFYILLEIVLHISQTVKNSLRIPKCGKNRTEFGSKTIQFTKRLADIFELGYKKEVKDKIWLRVTYSLFAIRLLVMLVVLTSAQKMAIFYLAIILFVQTLYMTHMIYIWIRYCPFQSLFDLLERITFNLSLSFLIVVLCLEESGIQNSSLDLTFLVMVSFSVISQLLALCVWIFRQLNRVACCLSLFSRSKANPSSAQQAKGFLTPEHTVPRRPRPKSILVAYPKYSLGSKCKDNSFKAYQRKLNSVRPSPGIKRNAKERVVLDSTSRPCICQTSTRTPSTIIKKVIFSVDGGIKEENQGQNPPLFESVNKLDNKQGDNI